jgi:hypothetical protein
LKDAGLGSNFVQGLGLECQNKILTQDIHHEKLPEILDPIHIQNFFSFMSKFHFDTPVGQIGTMPQLADIL